MQASAYRDAIESAGLRVETVQENDQFGFLSDSALDATKQWGVKSISLLAHRS